MFLSPKGSSFRGRSLSDRNISGNLLEGGAFLTYKKFQPTLWREEPVLLRKNLTPTIRRKEPFKLVEKRYVIQILEQRLILRRS